MGLLDLPEYILAERVLVGVPAHGLVQLLLTSKVFAAGHAQFQGRSLVEEAARLARRRRHDQSRVPLSPALTWLQVLCQLERLAAPLHFSRGHMSTSRQLRPPPLRAVLARTASTRWQPRPLLPVRTRLQAIAPRCVRHLRCVTACTVRLHGYTPALG